MVSTTSIIDKTLARLHSYRKARVLSLPLPLFIFDLRRWLASTAVARHASSLSLSSFLILDEMFIFHPIGGV